MTIRPKIKTTKRRKPAPSEEKTSSIATWPSFSARRLIAARIRLCNSNVPPTAASSRLAVPSV